MILQKLFAVTIYLVKGRLSTFFTNNYAMRGRKGRRTGVGRLCLPKKNPDTPGMKFVFLLFQWYFSRESSREYSDRIFL